MPAIQDIQMSMSSSKSVPMNPAKKNSFDYGSPDNQSLTFQSEIYSLLALVAGKLVA
jgi:hypothetical protein